MNGFEVGKRQFHFGDYGFVVWPEVELHVGGDGSLGCYETSREYYLLAGRLNCKIVSQNGGKRKLLRSLIFHAMH